MITAEDLMRRRAELVHGQSHNLAELQKCQKQAAGYEYLIMEIDTMIAVCREREAAAAAEAERVAAAVLAEVGPGLVEVEQRPEAAEEERSCDE